MNLSRCRDPHLVAWQRRRANEAVYLRKDITAFSRGSDDVFVVHDNGSLESGAATPVDIILIVTYSSSVVQHNDVGSDRETQYPLLPSSTRTFNLRPQPPSLHLLKAGSRTSQFSPLPNSTVSSTHTGFILSKPHARFLHFLWLRAVSFRPIFSSFSFALAFVLPITP